MRESSDAHETATVAPDAASLSAHTERLADGTLVGGRYELRGVFGSGGSAVVYRAYDRLIKREIALKVMRRERLTPNALIRLRREAAAARDVVHPNLIRVFDLGTADELTFLAMEAIEGESLRERLRRGALPVEEAVAIACDVLRALAALHEAGLLHRDVKPGNVLLAADGTVRLADLGLVRRWESTETRATESEAVIGTFEYLSPEQALGEELDARSDLFSLGAMLFEMIAGRMPHEGKSSLGTLLANLRQPVPTLRSLRSGVPRWLSDVVEKLLERERGARYASAAAALADLEQGRRPAGAWRPRGWRVAALIGLAVGLALVAGGLITKGRRSHFETVIFDGDSSVRAVDYEQRILWRLDNVRPSENFVTVRTDRKGGRAIAAVLGSSSGLGPGDERRTLHLLDPDTGERTGQMALPNLHPFLPGFSDRYLREVVALDVNSDGLDELVVSFHHMPFWPSFSALCEPALGRCHAILIASGHHRPIGVADVDGDGRAEILFAGINNRMGWLNGIAAVQVQLGIGERRGIRSVGLASTPDELRADANALQMAWYVLVPPGAGTVRRGFGVAIDQARRQVRLPNQRGQLTIDFDGFLASDRSTLPVAERQAERQRAYAALREARRLQDSSLAEQAVTLAREAVEHAVAANDSILLDWARRRLARALIAAERLGDAESVLEEGLATSVDPPGVAWEGANEYHLRGRLADAVRWYERGLAIDRDGFDGRFAHEFVEGELLALAELGRWQEARATLDRWSRSFVVVQQQAPFLESWIRWRTGTLTPNERSDARSTYVDFPGYVSLEIRAASGEDPAALLAETRLALVDASDTRAMLRSLEAELLGQLGLAKDAAASAREALVAGSEEAKTNLYARVHLDLIRERAARWGG